GKLQLDILSQNFDACTTASVDAARPSAEAKRITLEMSNAAGENEDRVIGDPDRLQQVVWNLLSNAVKFTPAEGRVEVRLDRVNGDLRLRVSDTGQGINPAFLSYVFDRFSQAD